MPEEKKDIAPKKNRALKKVLKILFYILIGIIGLNVVLVILLSIPSVQKQVIDFALGKIKPIVNTEISIEKVNIGFLSHVTLEGVYIEDQSQDTLLYTDRIDVRVNLLLLIGNRLEINSLDLDNAHINISQQTPDSPFNFQFLIDAFASNDTIKSEDSSPMAISIHDVTIKNARLNYDILSEPETPGTFNISHIALRELNANLDLGSIDTGDLDVAVKSLSFIEKSGLTVSNLEGDMKSQGTLLSSDKIKLTLPSSYLEANGTEYDLLDDRFAIQLTSDIHPGDLVFFMPQLKSLKNSIIIDTDISGKLPYINIEQALLEYGEDLAVKANASVSNYENPGDGEIKLIVDKFRITPEAIKQFAQIGDPAYTNPEILSSINYFSLKGSVQGELNNLDVNLDGWTEQGSVQLTGQVSTDTSFRDIRAKAAVKTQNFNLAPFAGAETGLGRLDMYADIDLISTENMEAKLSGTINSLQYKGDAMRNIRFKAQYSPAVMSGWVHADLPIGKLLAEASMTQSQRPEIKFEADIKELKVDYFYENPAWQNPKLNVHLKGDLKGRNIDDIQGEAVIDSLKLWGDNLLFSPDPFVLKSGITTEADRFISLNSPFVNAHIEGKYSFLTITDELTNIMHAYLPGLFAENKRVKTYKNDFNVNVTVNNSEKLGEIFSLPMDIIQPLTVNAQINTIDNKLSITGNAPHIRFGENNIRNTTLNVDNSLTSINANLKSELRQNNGIIGINLDVNAESDSVNTDFIIKSDQAEFDINGELKASAHFEYMGKNLVSYLYLIPTNLKIGSLDLTTLPSTIINEREKTSISNFGLLLNNKKYFGVDGIISPHPGDSVEIYFEQTQIGDILSAFDINNIKAEINGEVVVTNTLNEPELFTNELSLSDIIIFGDSLGTLYIESGWSSTLQAVDFNASLQNEISTSTINGHISTKKDSMNINVDLEKISLGWLEPFMSDIFNQVDGSLSAEMTLNGKIESPTANGWVGFNDVYFGLDITNVTYHISDTINVLPNEVGFNNLIIEDNYKNKATVNALVTHKNFRDMEYNLDANLNNFMILNTPNYTDSLFYGRLFASGNAKIKGNNERIDIDLNVKNEKNSYINITLPTTSEASDYQSIVYINIPVEDSIKNILTAKPEITLPIHLAMKLQVDPSVTLGIIINPETGDAMQVKGSGEIRFNYNMQTEEMSTYGEYILSEGNVKIRLQNLKTLEFRIREGSKLDLIGDPMKTTFDITAYRRVRTQLSTLDPESSDARINVDCVLGIKGNIDKIELTYDISLPDADEETQRKVRSMIITDEDKTKHFAWLVATGSFYPSSSSAGGNFGESVLTGLASSTLSQGLNAIFGSVLGKNWEIGADVASTDGTFSDVDMSVNLSTRLFDDRLKFNTNLGYRTESQAGGNENKFIGDFDIEYQLTRLWKLKAYNKTNENQFYKQAPTTQGIGIVYTKEAKTLKNLFRSYRRKRTTENDNK